MQYVIHNEVKGKMPFANISIRRALLDELDETADKYGLSRSELICALLEYALDNADLDKLFGEEESGESEEEEEEELEEEEES
jgi:metal-responsive CopG/Arc/MetJ family transcriptional regulator